MRTNLPLLRPDQPAAPEKKGIHLDALLFLRPISLKAHNDPPFAIALKSGQPYAFAGLWERWKDPKTKEALDTFTIITTDPNEIVEPLHNRMPVIIKPKDYDRWLTPGDPPSLPLDLLRPYPAEQMRAWKVDSRVGNVKDDEERLLGLT